MADLEEGPEENPTGLRKLLGRLQRSSPTIGTTEHGIGPGEVAATLEELGDAGGQARALDAAVEEALAGTSSLSELTANLALRYLDRIRQPLAALTLEAGVTLVTRGYEAHRAVEAAPAAYGSGPEIPVLGTLPDLRKGRPPQDLLNRVVKATRRDFERIRAVPGEVWEGFVVATMERTQAAAPGPRVLDRDVIEALVRLGWVLRQVDLRYGQAEPAT